MDPSMFATPGADPNGDQLGSRDMTSRYRGVTYNKKSRKWQAVINTGGKHIHLGTFTIEEDAATAFDKAALIVRGAKAKINFNLSQYLDADGNIIHDKTVNDKLNEAQDPNRKIRAKPTRRTPLGTPGGTPGGGLTTANLMAAAAAGLLPAGLTHAGMMNALFSASNLSMPGGTPGSAGPLGNPLGTPAPGASGATASEDGSGPTPMGTESDAAAAATAAATAAVGAELQRHLTSSLPGIQHLAGAGALLGGGAGGSGGNGATAAAAAAGEAGMWSMLEHLAASLPDGGVLDSFLPSVEAKALGVLFYTSPGGVPQYHTALWRDGQLMGPSPFASRDEAKKALTSTVALAATFAVAPSKPGGLGDGTGAAGSGAQGGEPPSPNSAAAAGLAAAMAALGGLPGLTGMTGDAMAGLTEEQLRALYAPLFTQAGSTPGSSAARGALPPTFTGDGLLAPGPNLSLPFPSGEAGQTDAAAQQVMELFQQQQTQELFRQIQALQNMTPGAADGTAAAAPGQEGQEGLKQDPAAVDQVDHLQQLQQQQQQLAVLLEQQAAAAMAVAAAAAAGPDQPQHHAESMAAPAGAEAEAPMGTVAQPEGVPVVNGVALPAVAPQGGEGEDGQNLDTEAIMALNQLRYASGELGAAAAASAMAAAAQVAAAATASVPAVGDVAVGGGEAAQEAAQEGSRKRAAPEGEEDGDGTEEGGGKRARADQE